MKNFRIFLLVTIGIGLFFIAKSFFLSDVNAQVLNLEDSDAIAVRIVPNPNHYSIARWYESQGFSGAPQALTVDGYEAVRDGRTVYVNAANVDGKNIYTNIYLISYNQSSTAKTIDILGQIVSHWKFNSNISNLESTNPLPNCAISSQNCLTDSNCGADQLCANSGNSSSSCVLKKTQNCLIDSECPNNFFCNSLKAKIIRDTKRIGQLEELKEALAKYKKINTHYPILGAGSYLTNHSISVWPSWSQNFLAGLSVSTNFLDPINRLGNCSGYNEKTCWNNILNKFVFNSEQNYLKLPAESYVMVYKTDTAGLNYNMCISLESRDPSLDYRFSPNDPSSYACVMDGGTTKLDNTAPFLVDKYLIGEAGREFNGFITVKDNENDLLTWTLYTDGTVWKNWSNNDLGAPILINSNIPDTKGVYAVLAGDPGDYNIGLRVDDGKGGVLSTTTAIKITNSAPLIEADDITYVLSAFNPFSYNFSFSDNNLDNPAANFTVTRLSGPFDLWGESKTVNFEQTGNTYKVTHSGIISTTHKFSQNTDFTYKIQVTDKYKAVSTKNFIIKVVVEKPFLDFNCPAKVRLGKNYSCLLGSAISNSRQNIIYSAKDPLLAALAINKNQASNFLIEGLASELKTINTEILAVDEYGATSSKPYLLKSNNYCGDGKIQLPNTEGQGGPYNNGYENCDGLEGTTNIVASSSIINQYACSTKVGDITPDIFASNSYCSFVSPLDGGGYCGDGYCSALDANGLGLETTCNCEKDCATPDKVCKPPNGPACGNGIIDPGEDCDGTNVDHKFCMSFTLSPPGFTCNSNCKFNTTDCIPNAHNVGSYFNETDNKLYSCPLGTFGVFSTNMFDPCLPCPAGTFAAGVGTFTAGLGNYQCTHCQTGYASMPGSSSCSPITTTCPSGKYASGTSCLDCTAGYYCLGGYGRAACPFGYTGPAGSDSKTKCTPCPANTYATSGASVCTPCPAGYVSSPGQSVCIMLACRSGYYLSGSSCEICPAGNYCTGCFGPGNNTWAYYDNCVSSITPCPAGTTSLPGSSYAPLDCK